MSAPTIDESVVRFGYRMGGGKKVYTFVALWVAEAKRWYTTSAAPDRPSILTDKQMLAVLDNAEWVQYPNSWTTTKGSA